MACDSGAQLIDGLWWQSRSGKASRMLRIGLSTSSHGYYTITPLVHAATLVCAFVWLSLATVGDGGYYVDVPSELLQGANVTQALTKTGRAVSFGPAALCVAMVLRAFVEMGTCRCSRSIEDRGSDSDIDTNADMTRSLHPEGVEDDASDDGGRMSTTKIEWSLIPTDWQLTFRGTKLVRVAHDVGVADATTSEALGTELEQKPEPGPSTDSQVQGPVVGRSRASSLEADDLAAHNSGSDDDSHWLHQSLLGAAE